MDKVITWRKDGGESVLKTLQDGGDIVLECNIKVHDKRGKLVDTIYYDDFERIKEVLNLKIKEQKCRSEYKKVVFTCSTTGGNNNEAD